MPAMLNMSLPLATRLANLRAGAPYRNEIYGRYTAQPDRPGVYYVDKGALRCAGFAEDLARLRHSGWYTDREIQEDLMRGVVYRLPGRDGKPRLVAGYHYNGGDDKGATLFFDTIYDDEKEAAQMADEHARVAADPECDYQDEQRAKMAEEDAEQERRDAEEAETRDMYCRD